METVECCCCGAVADFEQAQWTWYPAVYHGHDTLGDLCDDCAAAVGLRDSLPGEYPCEEQVVDWEAFCLRRDEFAKGK
jgi:hypothetical protein